MDRLDLLFAAFLVVGVAVATLAELARRQIRQIDGRLEGVSGQVRDMSHRLEQLEEELVEIRSAIGRDQGHLTEIERGLREIATDNSKGVRALNDLQTLASETNRRADRHDDQILSVLRTLSALRRGEPDFNDEYYRLRSRERA